MNALFLNSVLLMLALFGMTASAQGATWIADRNFGICTAGQPCDPVAACQDPYFLYLYDREGTPLICFNSLWYIRVGFNLAESCSQGIDPETYQCIGENSCNNQTAISSSISGTTACYNQCAYDSMGGFRDYDNALSPISYEYVPTGASCDGTEEVDLSGNAAEYGDTNEQQQSCRDDGIYQVCIDAEQSCKVINGVSVCIDNQTREDFYNCGTFNGEVVCFAKNELSNCQYLNGEQFCTYSDGVKVDPDSADHPGNGGNANGNNNDDFLDQADLDNNTPEAEATKKTISDSRAKHIADKQAEIDDPSSSFSGIECDKTVSCSGDAIQCAIARIQKKQLCLSEFNQSEIQQIIDTNPLMSPLGSLPDEHLEIDVADYLDTEQYVSSYNQCPEPLTFSVMGREYQIIMTPLCDLAETISYFILFATWFSMAIILAKTLGS